MTDPMAAILSGTSDHGSLSQQVSAVIKKANDNSAKLDTLNNVLRIIATDSYTLHPISGVYSPAVLPVGAGVANTFLCFLSRSDDPGKVYPVPYLEVVGGIGSLTAQLVANASIDKDGVRISAECASTYSSPPDLTFYWFVIAQPADSTL